MSSGEKFAPERSRPFRVPKTSELVASELRRRIVRGELTEGQSLPAEAELCTHYGVSRPTLREAFRILESQNLLVIRRGAHGGPQIQAPDPDVAAMYAGLVLQYRSTSLADVRSARECIEPYAARLAAERATPDDISELETALERETSAEDEEEVARAGAQFHALVAKLADSETLWLFHQVISGIIEAHTVSVVTQDAVTANPEAHQDLVESARKAHRRLVKLIASNDGPGAERFWRKHLEGVAPYYNRHNENGVIDLFQAP